MLHIGSKLANPLAATKESFAVCHFLNYTASTTFEIIVAVDAPGLATSVTHVEQRDTRAAAAGAEATPDRKRQAARKVLEQTFAEQVSLKLCCPAKGLWVWNRLWTERSTASQGRVDLSVA